MTKKENTDKVIIVKRSEEKEVEQREKSRWIRDILKKMGIPGIEDWGDNLTMNDLRRIRKELKMLSVDIIDDSDNGIDIYWNMELIAEWKRPTYILRVDPNEIDQKYKYYLEMHLNTNDAFNATQEEKNRET